jgi:hypothetical protein
MNYLPPVSAETKYLESGCTKCPWCSSANFQRYQPRDYIKYWARVNCLDCNGSWYDELKVVKMHLGEQPHELEPYYSFEHRSYQVRVYPGGEPVVLFNGYGDTKVVGGVDAASIFTTRAGYEFHKVHPAMLLAQTREATDVEEKTMVEYMKEYVDRKGDF